MDTDQRLCDYIFGLLDEAEVLALEVELKQNQELTSRLSELNEIFGGLDTVKKDYPSPISKLMNRFYQVSYACLTMASAFTIFWATMFGAVSAEGVEVSQNSENSNIVTSGFSCTSATSSPNFISLSFSDLSNFRK